MMATKVVLFDVHETLAHWPEERVESIEVQRLLSRFGIEISFWAYEAARQTILLLDAPKREIHGWMDYLALVFARMDVAVSVDLLSSIAAMYEDRDGMALYADGLDAVRQAKASVRTVGTFTTLPPFMLGASGRELLPLLDEYFNCSKVGVAKGDRRFYERITERLGVAPNEILCVGDNPTGDVALPAECGWQAILLDRKGRHGDVRGSQVGTISTLRDLSTYYE